MYTCIVNASVIYKNKILEKHSILIKNERIVGVFPDNFVNIPENSKIIDANEGYVSPGFIDIHCHGSRTEWFYENPKAVSKYHLEHGTTSVFATTRLLESHEEIVKSIERIVEGIESDETTIEGIHMECPYLNPKYGAYRERSRKPLKVEYTDYMAAGKGYIRTWTIAPELENICEMIRDLQSEANGKLVFQVGHSEAEYKQIKDLILMGLRIGTHTTNATGYAVNPPKFGGTREIGVDESVWLEDDIFSEVIADSDGAHVRADMLKLILKIKGINKTIVVTDSTVSEFDASGNKGSLPEGDVNYTNNGELMGSALTMDVAISNIMKHTNISLAQAISMGTYNPAVALDLSDDMGLIAPGRLANLLFIQLDQDGKIEINKILLKGKEVNK